MGGGGRMLLKGNRWGINHRYQSINGRLQKGKGEETNFYYPTHPFPLLFLPQLTPLEQISFSPQPFAAVKIKDGSFVFTKHILNTRSPKLHLLGRLCESRSVCKCQCLDHVKYTANTYLLCNRKVRIVEPCSHDTVQGGAVCSARLWAG